MTGFQMFLLKNSKRVHALLIKVHKNNSGRFLEILKLVGCAMFSSHANLEEFIQNGADSVGERTHKKKVLLAADLHPYMVIIRYYDNFLFKISLCILDFIDERCT